MTRPNGCYNRAPFRPWLMVQEGWFMDGVTRTPRMTTVPFRLSTDCQYQRDPMGVGSKDPRCDGCRWKQEAKA